MATTTRTESSNADRRAVMAVLRRGEGTYEGEMHDRVNRFLKDVVERARENFDPVLSLAHRAVETQ